MSLKLAVVVPCYNEQEVLFETAKVMYVLFENLIRDGIISDESAVFMVDDGSSDNTWSLIEKLGEQKMFHGIKLAHNTGHQNALLAGLMCVKDEYDCAVSIDADLQDDVYAIEEMVKKHIAGAEVVYGVRRKRDTDTFFKRTTAAAFYKLMKVMGVDVIYNHADYRLMGSRALNALAEFTETNLFLRGVVPLIGYKSDIVYYDRSERFAGKSKYPLRKMLSFAFDGISSFSISPVRIVTGLGGFACVIALIVGIYSIVQKILGNANAGWTSIICSIWLLGGLQLLGIGLIGEYIGKIYKETKRRPRYIIEKQI